MVTNACVNVIDVASQFEGVQGLPQHDPLLTSDPTFVTPTSSFPDGDGEIIFPCFFLKEFSTLHVALQLACQVHLVIENVRNHTNDVYYVKLL